jgi:hypothetical protein
MALVLEANYSKKLGLPGYSSHQYAVTIRTELADLTQVEAESARLYSLLQSCVDQEIQQTGYLPENSGKANGHAHRPTNGNGHHLNGHSEKWNCSDKQRELIQKIIAENNLDKNQLEELSQERFGKPVKTLNKLEASGFIEELFRQVNPNGNGTGNGHRNGNSRFQKAGAR